MALPNWPYYIFMIVGMVGCLGIGWIARGIWETHNLHFSVSRFVNFAEKKEPKATEKSNKP